MFLFYIVSEILLAIIQNLKTSHYHDSARLRDNFCPNIRHMANQCTKFDVSSFSHSRDVIAIIFPKMAAFCHLGSVGHISGCPTKSNWMEVFIIMQSLFGIAVVFKWYENWTTLYIWLETPMYIPKMGVSRAFYPLNRVQYQCNSRRHFLV